MSKDNMSKQLLCEPDLLPIATFNEPWPKSVKRIRRADLRYFCDCIEAHRASGKQFSEKYLENAKRGGLVLALTETKANRDGACVYCAHTAVHTTLELMTKNFKNHGG